MYVQVYTYLPSGPLRPTGMFFEGLLVLLQCTVNQKEDHMKLVLRTLRQTAYIYVATLLSPHSSSSLIPRLHGRKIQPGNEATLPLDMMYQESTQ